MNKKRVIEWICRIVIGGVFIWAGIQKISVPCDFAMDIYHYQMAPGFVINLAAIILPALEIVLGFCLIIGLAPRGAAMGISLILVFFILVLSINMFRGIEFDCGCFGDPEKDWCHILTQTYQSRNPDLPKADIQLFRTQCDIVRDFIFLGFSVTAFVLLRKRLDRRPHRYRL